MGVFLPAVMDSLRSPDTLGDHVSGVRGQRAGRPAAAWADHLEAFQAVEDQSQLTFRGQLQSHMSQRPWPAVYAMYTTPPPAMYNASPPPASIQQRLYLAARPQQMMSAGRLVMNWS